MRRHVLLVLALGLLLGGCTDDSRPTRRSSGSPSPSVFETRAAPTPSASTYPEERCDGTTTDMNACVAAVRDQVERELNVVYARVRRQLLADEKEGLFSDVDEAHESVHPAAELRDAERAFLTYRRRMCDATYDAWVTGTIRVINALECEISVTRTQIDSIRSLVGP